MSKSLIICEKPDLGRKVAQAIGANKRADGYLYNDEYVVSWLWGHFFELNDISDYEGRDVKWAEISLPFFPKEYQFKLKSDDGTKKQFKILKGLIGSKEIDTIINCGDADREGQIIVDIPLKICGNKKPVKRLWLPDQTPDTIRHAMKNLKNNSEYKNLYDEGMCRTYMDWALGINLTIHLSVKSGVKLNTGRVIVPMVKLIYDREMEIRNFVPEKYYLLESEANGVKLSLKKPKFKADEKDKALAYAAELNKNKAVVIDVQREAKERKPSKLFSLSSLQAELSKKHNISFDDSLKIIQNLYEKGYLTYPRTNTEYMSEDEKDRVKEIIRAHNIEGVAFKDGKHIFDSSKVESHSAITVTTSIPSNLTDIEDKVYSTVYNRFMANFTSEKCIVDQTKMTIAVGNEKFVLKGEIISQEGFTRFEPLKLSNNLPNLKKGDEFDVDFKPIEKTTTPPPRITEASLGAFCENPFGGRKKKKESDETLSDEVEDEDEDAHVDDSEEYKAILAGVEIGTPATRTPTIKKIIDTGYVTLKKKQFYLEDLGEKFIKILDKLGVNLYKEKTVELSILLKNVFKGEKSIGEVVSATHKEIAGFIDKNVVIEKIRDGSSGKGFPPTKKMIAFVEDIAKRKNIVPPKGYKKDSSVCKTFINEHVKPRDPNSDNTTPSNKQIEYAKSIAEKLNIQLDENTLKDKKALSDFISKKAGSLGAYKLSEAQRKTLADPKNASKVSKNVLKLLEKETLTKDEYMECNKAIGKIKDGFKKK